MRVLPADRHKGRRLLRVPQKRYVLCAIVAKFCLCHKENGSWCDPVRSGARPLASNSSYGGRFPFSRPCLDSDPGVLAAASAQRGFRAPSCSISAPSDLSAASPSVSFLAVAFCCSVSRVSKYTPDPVSTTAIPRSAPCARPGRLQTLKTGHPLAQISRC